MDDYKLSPMNCEIRRGLFYLDEKAMEAMVTTGGTAVEIVTQLIQTALSRGARDNVTAVLARYQGE